MELIVRAYAFGPERKALLLSKNSLRGTEYPLISDACYIYLREKLSPAISRPCCESFLLRETPKKLFATNTETWRARNNRECKYKGRI